jgi:hypothetical protein
MSTAAAVFVFSTGTLLAQSDAQAPSANHKAVAGDLKSLSPDGKTITVKTTEGTEENYKVTGETTVNGAKGGPLAGKEGSHVVVHYTEKGAERTAIGVKDAGKGTWKVTEGTVSKIGKGGREVTVKLKDGSEKTYHVGKEATVATGHGIEETGKYSGKAGETIVVYSVVDPSKEVAHLFKKF